MKNIFINTKTRSVSLLVIGLFLTIYLVSCTGDFEEINTNPNGAVSIPTTYLLTSAQQKLIGRNSSLAFNKTMMFYSQLWSQRETTNRSRYDLSAESDWSGFYNSGIPDLVSIIELNTGDDKDSYSAYGDNGNQIAVARIMKAWAFSLMTDAWGDIPYSEAHNRDVTFPSYDLQSDIYPMLIIELKEAAAQINESAPGFTSGDLLYGGNMTLWKKFANSLRARVAVRMMKANSSLAMSELSDALSSPVFESNDEQAIIFFQNDDANANPLYIEFLNQNWTFPSELLINRLISLNDPRISIYAEPNISSAYVGLPYGLGDEASTAAPWLEDNLSKIGSVFREQSTPSILMSHSELLFIKAEAAEKGWVAGTASSLYDDAITSNMEFLGVSGADIATYLADPGVVYSAGNSAALIGEQKWISFYNQQGPQAFFEWRRTGEPNLVLPNSAPLFNEVTEIPRRYFYPIQEQQLNGENLDLAKSRIDGGDVLTSKIWIDQ